MYIHNAFLKTWSCSMAHTGVELLILLPFPLPPMRWTYRLIPLYLDSKNVFIEFINSCFITLNFCGSEDGIHDLVHTSPTFYH